MLTLLRASEDMRDRYDFSLALLDDMPRRYAAPAGLDIHQLDARGSLWRSIVGLSRLAARQRPDVTLSFLTRSNIACVAVARMFRHRAIISERANTSGHFAPGAGGVLAKRLIGIFYPAADRVIAVSHGIADDLAANFGVARARISTIANPVDTAAIQAAALETAPLPAKGRFAVAVSRLSRSKNVILLVEALAASGLDLSLVVMGEGPEREAILARAAALGVRDRVILTGFLANPFPIVRAAACYLSASNGEGFPNGLVEALALGVPVAATNCPSGPSEVLADKRREEVAGVYRGKFGILVPQNDVNAMAEALRTIVEPDVARGLAAAGPGRALEFDVETAKRRYWEVIEAQAHRRVATKELA